MAVTAEARQGWASCDDLRLDDGTVPLSIPPCDDHKVTVSQVAYRGHSLAEMHLERLSHDRVDLVV